MGVQSSYSNNMTAAFEGGLADSGANDVIPQFNAEASAELRFGQAVCFEGGGSDDGKNCLSPDAITDVISGIVLRSHDYEVGSAGYLGTTGIKANGMANVLRKGRIWAKCENGCVPGDRLHIRALGGDEGALRSAADGVNTIASTGQGQWLTKAAAGALAVLEVDFTNKAA